MAQFCPEDFDEYATVQELTRVPDNAGGFTTSWAERVGVWCKIETTSGGEVFDNGRLKHDESLNLTTHYNSDIVPVDRVELDGIFYKITRVEDVDRKHEFMIIYLETGET